MVPRELCVFLLLLLIISLIAVDAFQVLHEHVLRNRSHRLCRYETLSAIPKSSTEDYLDDHTILARNREPGSVSRRAAATSLVTNMAAVLFSGSKAAFAEEDEESPEVIASDNETNDALPETTEETDDDDQEATTTSTEPEWAEYVIKDFTVSLPNTWEVVTSFDKDATVSASSSGSSSTPILFSATDFVTGGLLTVVEEEACELDQDNNSKKCDFIQTDGGAPIFSDETFQKDSKKLLRRHDDRSSAFLQGSSTLDEANLDGRASNFATDLDSSLTSATYYETSLTVLDLKATTSYRDGMGLDQPSKTDRRVLARAVATTTTITRTKEEKKPAATKAKPPEENSEPTVEPASETIQNESTEVLDSKDDATTEESPTENSESDSKLTAMLSLLASVITDEGEESSASEVDRPTNTVPKVDDDESSTTIPVESAKYDGAEEASSIESEEPVEESKRESEEPVEELKPELEEPVEESKPETDATESEEPVEVEETKPETDAIESESEPTTTANEKNEDNNNNDDDDDDDDNSNASKRENETKEEDTEPTIEETTANDKSDEEDDEPDTKTIIKTTATTTKIVSIWLSAPEEEWENPDSQLSRIWQGIQYSSGRKKATSPTEETEKDENEDESSSSSSSPPASDDDEALNSQLLLMNRNFGPR